MSGSPIEILCGEFPRMPRYQIEGFYKGSEQNLELTRKLIRTHLGITIVENLVLYEITDSFDSLIDRPGHLLVEIASDCSMSTGYPKVFKKKFGIPAVGNDLFQAIEPTNSGRFVYYLVTRDRYFNVATNLEHCLEQLKLHVQQHDIREISMPRIGHKLSWVDVKQMILTKFSELELKINVYLI